MSADFDLKWQMTNKTATFERSLNGLTFANGFSSIFQDCTSSLCIVQKIEIPSST